MNEAIIEKARQFAQFHFADDGSGHDWWHIDRVRRMALRLAEPGNGAWRALGLAAREGRVIPALPALPNPAAAGAPAPASPGQWSMWGWARRMPMPSRRC